MGCPSNTLTTALPTNQSPPRTSRGDPAREYGWEVAPKIGKRVKNARPAPRAPLGAQSDISEVPRRYRFRSPVEKLGIRELFRHLGLDELVIGIHP